MSEPNRQSAAPPKVDRIGRYTIERFLARGGMAEVFLGKAEGPGGFAKQVVVKRIHPDLCEEDRFVSMFLDEAKLAAQLNHPNIVQVYDFGEQDGLYFIAMEYVPGETLRSIVRALGNMGRKLSPRIAAQIMVGICEGLQYAHQLTDEHGNPGNVIHRDVTPDNILVSASGIPKLVDFGIAKASSQSNRTEGGMLKGKYGYMSPEQIRGDGIDHRLDVYALGISLYEVLAGHRPYRAENELALMREVMAANAVPLNQANKDVPEFLAEVVANAMHPDADLRYHDARAFQSGLEDFLQSTGARVQAAEIADVVKEITAYRRAKNGDLGPQHTPSAVGSPGTGPKGTPKPAVKPGSGPKPAPATVQAAPRPPPRAALPDLSDPEEVEEQTRRMDLEDLIGLPEKAEEPAESTKRVSLAQLQALSDQPEPPTKNASIPARPPPRPAEPQPIVLEVEPMPAEPLPEDEPVLEPPTTQAKPQARALPHPHPAHDPDPEPSLADLIMEPVEVEGSQPLAFVDGTRRLPNPLNEGPEPTPTDRNTAPGKAAGGRPKWLIPAVAGAGLLVVAGIGFFLLHDDKPAPRAPVVQHKATNEELAAATDAKPQPKAEAKPEPKPEAKPDPKPEAKADPKPDAKPAQPDVKPDPKPDAKPQAVAVADTGKPGYLTVKSERSFEITIDGQKLGTTPLPRVELSAGKHDVVARNKDGVEKKFSVTIASGQEQVKEVNLGRGKLEVKVQPWAKVSVDGKDVGTTPFPALELTEGSHKVVLSNPELGKTETKTVKIKSGQKETVKVLW